MRVCRRLALARRAVKELVALAEKRAVQVERIRAAPSLRPLSEAETESILGVELLARLVEVITS